MGKHLNRRIVIGKLNEDPVKTESGRLMMNIIQDKCDDNGDRSSVILPIYVINKGQQDAVLKHVRKGDLVCIEATMGDGPMIADRITFLAANKLATSR